MRGDIFRRMFGGGAAVLVASALLVAAGGASASAAALQETEPNDHYSTANQLPLGATIQGATGGTAASDADFFAFDVPADGRVGIDLRFPAGLAAGKAYDVVIEDQKGGSFFSWSVTTADAAGEYLRAQPIFLAAGGYVVIIAASDDRPIWNQPYTLSVTSTPELVETEPNEGKADDLPLGSTMHGTTFLLGGRDSDSYVFDVPQDGRVSIDLRFEAGLPSGPGYGVLVYRDDGTLYSWQVDASASDGSFLRDQATFLAAGRYHLLITGSADRATWGKEYTLVVTATPGAVETEQNDDFARADALPLGRQIHGSMLGIGDRDQDFFAIDMPAAGAVRLDLTYPAGMGDADTHHVSVFDAKRAVITTFTLNGRDADGKRLRSTPIPLPAGRAYVRVLGDYTWASWATEYVLSATRVSVPGSTVTRLAGTDRYSTAVAISRASFQPGVPVAYVSSGLDFPDALAGAPVAAMNGAPILLVRPTSIPSAVTAELKRLTPKRIIVLGGAGVVSEKVRTRLDALTSGSATRLAGADRYATSAAISRASFPSASVVYLANGSGFADALSGAPVAGMKKGPVLLVKRDSIPASVARELIRLSPSEVVVLGGDGAISHRVTDRLPLTTEYTVRWLFGEDRYGTSADISQASFARQPSVAYIANGLTFPDALAGAVVAGMQRGPVLLVAAGSIPAEVRTELQRLKPHKIVVLGGTGVVSEKVKAQLAQFAIP